MHVIFWIMIVLPLVPYFPMLSCFYMSVCVYVFARLYVFALYAFCIVIVFSILTHTTHKVYLLVHTRQRSGRSPFTLGCVSTSHLPHTRSVEIGYCCCLCTVFIYTFSFFKLYWNHYWTRNWCWSQWTTIFSHLRNIIKSKMMFHCWLTCVLFCISTTDLGLPLAQKL